MSSGRSLVILGNGGHAHSVAEAAESAGFRVVDLVNVGVNEKPFAALLRKLQTLDLRDTSLALGLGSNFARAALHQAITREFAEAEFPRIIHKTGWVSPSAAIEDGVAVLAHACAGPNVSVGVGSIVNTGASLDHDSTLGAFASLGPGARTGGNVKIGPRSMIGLQAGILQGRTVGEDSVVGAQSLVLEDIPSLSVAVGSPSRVIRSRERDERYY